MPTIAFVSPKGGAVKDHVGIHAGYGVNSGSLRRHRHRCRIRITQSKTWAVGDNTPPRLGIVSDVDEETIMERIDDAASKDASGNRRSGGHGIQDRRSTRSRERILWSFRLKASAAGRKRGEQGDQSRYAKREDQEEPVWPASRSC